MDFSLSVADLKMKSAIFNRTRRGLELKIGKVNFFFIVGRVKSYRIWSDGKKGNFRLKRAGWPFYRRAMFFTTKIHEVARKRIDHRFHRFGHGLTLIDTDY